MGNWLNRQLGVATFTPASELPAVPRLDPNSQDSLEAIAAMYQDDYGPLDPTASEEGMYSFGGNKIANALKALSKSQAEMPEPLTFRGRDLMGSLPSVRSGSVSYRTQNSPYRVQPRLVDAVSYEQIAEQALKDFLKNKIRTLGFGPLI